MKKKIVGLREGQSCLSNFISFSVQRREGHCFFNRMLFIWALTTQITRYTGLQFYKSNMLTRSKDIIQIWSLIMFYMMNFYLHLNINYVRYACAIDLKTIHENCAKPLVFFINFDYNMYKEIRYTTIKPCKYCICWNKLQDRYNWLDALKFWFGKWQFTIMCSM